MICYTLFHFHILEELLRIGKEVPALCIVILHSVVDHIVKVKVEVVSHFLLVTFKKTPWRFIAILAALRHIYSNLVLLFVETSDSNFLKLKYNTLITFLNSNKNIIFE